MAGDVCLFKEKRIKTSNGQMEEMAETVYGTTGEQGIENAFADIFKKLGEQRGDVGAPELSPRTG